MKPVAVLTEDNYQVLEVWYPYLRLREEAMAAVFVGTGKKHYKSKEGYPVEEERSIQEVKPQDFSGVIIPGGYAPDILRRHQEVVDFVKGVFDGHKLVASICHGGWVLVSAGVLKNKRATGFFSIKDDLVNAGALYEDKEVVVDDNLVTSRNPYDLPAFCRETIKFLSRSK
ncbi:MAG: type 1 glutamine amidotransferase [Candidatus Omnitrophica bacterium]|nr:type 1 glutamine amidotransferase [Candidatus Omnitrophota bacterium]